MSILNKVITLKLNAVGRCIGWMTVRAAITDMCGGLKTPPSLAYDITYAKLDDGTYDFTRMADLRAVGWTEWITLPVRDYDMAIPTGRGEVRVPTVLVVPHFSRMPMVRQTVNRKFFYDVAGGRDGYTGEPVPLSEGTLDHIIPREQGGTRAPTNLVWASLRTNQFKRNRRPEQCGLKLRVKPQAPKRVPIESRIREIKHRDWVHFVHTR